MINKDVDGIIIFNKKQSDKDVIETFIHELIHVAQFKFGRTARGAKLERAIFDSGILNDEGLVRFMQDEYYNAYDKQTNLNKFYEVFRAFIGGKFHGQTMGSNAFKKYLDEFMNYLNKLFSGIPIVMDYASGLSSEYAKLVKGYEKELGLKASSTEKFGKWISNILTLGKQAKSKEKIEGLNLFSRNATDEEIKDVTDTVLATVYSEYLNAQSNGEVVNASELLSFIAKTREARLFSVNISRSIFAGSKLFCLAFSTSI
jgi:hypothetical protein